MGVPINTSTEIAAMREGGKILASIFKELKDFVQVGQSEREVNAWVEQKIRDYGATPTYKEPSVNFPGVICISVNDQVVHSVPSDRKFKVGDIVSFDLVITYKNMKTDAAFTVIMGEEPTGAKKRLVDATEQSLYAAIDAITGPVYTGDIAAAVEEVLTQNQLGIVRDLVGHGIGREMHQPPDVPNFGRPGTGTLLRAGNTIAIEPMATLGDYHVVMGDDKWTIRTQDGSLAAHFEHTVLITEDGAEILTAL
jgi:methionyl aminopeptidase